MPPLRAQSTPSAGESSIKVVSELTAIPMGTLRAWERRYGFPKPARRADSNRRLYSATQVAQLRGSLPGDSDRSAVTLRTPSGRELARVVGLAALYSGTTAPLGSLLLATCAFSCGTLWGLLRITTRSLVAPILAHVVWDLGVLLLWPLAT